MGLSSSQLTVMILDGTGNGNQTGIILINLQKAFDALDHIILLDKMVKHNIR